MSRDITASIGGVCLQDWRNPDRWRRTLLLACTALAGFAALPAQAQTWQGVFSGDWNDAGNWDNSAVPGALSDVVIGSYSNAPVIGGGLVANASSVTIGAEFNPSVLTVTGASTLFTSGGPSFSGFGPDEEGHIVINANSTWNSNDNVFIGLDGIGRLTLGGNSTSSVGGAYIGMGQTGDGAVSLSNSDWTVSNLLVVGGAGDGELAAQFGSTVSSAEARIGALAGGEGLVAIQSGSSWAVTDELFIGDEGDGRLIVSTGGTVTSDVGILGAQSGSYGFAWVNNAASSWTMTSALGVGYAGLGQMQIYDQGQVNVGTDAYIGVAEGGFGSIVIDTQGDLSIAGDLNAGIEGEAMIFVEGGGTMSSTGARLGTLETGFGRVSVDGAGSGWTNTGSLVLGDFGNGRLTVANGAGVTNAGSTTLGLSPGGVGLLLVDNATFTTTDGLSVGGAGFGGMTVVGGGTVTSAQNAGNASIGFGGTGTVSISGAGSSWTNHDQLLVGIVDIGGNAGQGSLLVTDSAQFTNNGIAYLGFNAGSTGAVTVSDNGTWTNTSALYVGNEGHGTLIIEDGGSVSATNATIAAAQGSTGTVVANGNGIVWSNSGGLAIGGAGEAELVVGTGATVLAQGAILAAALPTSSATVTVDGVLAGLGGITFNANSHLSGTGIVTTAGGTTTMNGTIAPGNSIGTLGIVGDYVQNAGSAYEVEIDAAGNSDLIDVSGIATITGGEVVVVPFPDLAIATPYTILTAAGGVTGQFDGASMASAFLTPILSDDLNNIYLTIQQSATFESAAMTPNQIATAQGTDSLPTSNPVWTAIAMLPDAPSAQFAFDQLSGEIHASAKTALLEDSRFAREAALDRLRNALGGAGTTSGLAEQEMEGSATLWARGFGSWSHWDSDGNAATLSRNIGGLFVGGDSEIFENVRFGLMGGYSRSSLNVSDRASSGTVDSYTLGAYAGGEWDAFSLKGGLAHSWHSLDTSRSAAFTGFSDSLSASYNARTFQAYTEAAYTLEHGAVRIEPFANLAYVNLSTDAFTETGGAAALSALGQSANATFTTLGVRGETQVDLGGIATTLSGGIGWRHAFGDAPTSTHSFAGGNAFTVAGVPLARDTLVLDAGLEIDLTDNAKFGLGYSGQIGSGLSDHGVRANLAVQF